MTNKSHVGRGYSVCPICGKEHDEVVLLDRKLKDSLEFRNFMGFDICLEDRDRIDKGYVAVIECSNQDNGKEHITFQDADRTGRLAYITKEAFADLFKAEVPKAMCFIDVETFTKLEALVAFNLEKQNSTLH